jgi:O-antigen/teichoic acid export membrane protein
MSQLKSLAGQTAIYGVSSILGRVLNYLLVFLHTEKFIPEEMGQVSDLYAWVTFFMVTYTFGMETTFFRFTSKDKSKDYYHLAGTVVLVISGVITLIALVNSDWIASLAGYPQSSNLITWLALIVFIDAITSIPFAKLRIENQAKTFAVAKIISIITNIGLQVFFILFLPKIAAGELLISLQSYATYIYDPTLGVGYIFLANLISSAILIPILWKYIISFRFSLDWVSLKPMLKYATPLFVTGLAGMGIEQLDKIMLPRLLTDGFYSNLTSVAALGVYAQTLKLSIFISLAIQAFRYAAEPFFFSNASDKNSPELFAKVMHYFVLLSLIVFITVSINVELLAVIFLRSEAYRVALYIVPIALFAKLLWGVYVNMSIWFKLTDRTIFGTYFNIVGASIIVIGNFVLIPYLGFIGSLISMTLCYIIMCVLCFWYGKRYFPIPYKFTPLFIHTSVAALIVYLSYHITLENYLLDNVLNIMITLAYILIIWLLEKKKLKAESI